MCRPIPAAAGGVQKKLRPLLREVATAFPQAQVELWAVDEHRIGLKPILHKVWCFDGQRPLAPVQHRYEWRYSRRLRPSRLRPHRLPSGDHREHPALRSRTRRLCRQSGAQPRQADCAGPGSAGWHSTQRLRVPDHVHLLFLPPYSPELQPAEHLWPLTNTVLVNRHFATIDDLEDAQAARCVAPRKPAPISSARPPCSIGGRSASEKLIHLPTAPHLPSWCYPPQ